MNHVQKFQNINTGGYTKPLPPLVHREDSLVPVLFQQSAEKVWRVSIRLHSTSHQYAGLSEFLPLQFLFLQNQVQKYPFAGKMNSKK